MPFYNSKGKIPSKRHTAFYPNKNLSYEELLSREGFSGIYSNLYHINRPTKIKKVGKKTDVRLNHKAKTHRARHILTSNIDTTGDILDKHSLFFNSDLTISVININKNGKFSSNAQ